MIVVLFTGHVGSSWLTSMLAAHPELYRLGFEPVDEFTEKGMDAQHYFQSLWDSEKRNRLPPDARLIFEKNTPFPTGEESDLGNRDFRLTEKYVLFKTRLMLMKQKGFFLEWLPERRPFLLLLRRRNKIKNAISQYKRTQLKISHLKEFDKTSEKRRPVRVDPEYIIKKAEQFTLRELRTKAYFSLLTERCGASGREVLYEDLLIEESRDEFFDALFSQLGLQPSKLHSSYRKMTRDALDKAVENSDELFEAVGRTEFSRCLMDDNFDIVDDILAGRHSLQAATNDHVLDEIEQFDRLRRKDVRERVP